MQQYLLNLMPTSMFIALVCCVLIITGLAIHALIDKGLKNFKKRDNNGFLISVASIVSASYAFLLGFVIVSLWQTNKEAEHVTDFESYQLRFILNDCPALKSVEGEIRKGIRDYVSTVVNEEWDLMRVSQSSEAVMPIIRKMLDTLKQYEPKTEVERTFYKEIVTKANKLIEYRARRLELSKSSLIDQLRFMMIMGALFILSIVALIESESKSIHRLGIVVISCVIGFNLGLAFCIDYPFSGDIAVKSYPFKHEELAEFS